MYLHDISHTSANHDEAALSPANGAQLSKTWAFKTGGAVAAGSTVVGGVAYVGSWDGYLYALDANTGQQRWRTYLGQTNNMANCDTLAGITSTATVDGGVVYVGGGDSNFYALDAGTGNILWRVFIGDNSPASGHYNWSSPLLYHGNAYLGVASFCDTPLVQGQLLQISLAGSHAVRAFNVVSAGQVGGGIWTSPSVDPTTNTIFVDTGNEGGAGEPYARAILALDADSLAVKSVWQLPASGIPDPDWGTTPVLFTDANGHQLVEASNKDGFAYAFDRNDLAAGPVWQTRIAWGGPDPEGSGDGTVSSVVFDGTRIYAAGGRTTIGTLDVPGSVAALDPATGAVIWQRAAPGSVLPALAYANGVLVDGAGRDVEVLDASSGALLFTYATGAVIFGPPAISNGHVYIGSTDGSEYAFAPPNTTPPPPLTGGQCAVAYAIDGETVQCIDGSRVRFVGVASPLGAELGADWATAVTNWLLAGRTLTLERDVTATDQFGSRYGYPHVTAADGHDYNLSVVLIYIGMAHHLSDGVNVRYNTWLDGAQAWARTACWNMWAAGNPFAGESGCR
jgi:outer membrane protein assembly factor BamB